MNILKSLKVSEPDFFKHAFSLLDLNSRFDELLANGNRFFSAQQVGRHLILTPRPSIDYPQAVQTLSSLLSPEYLALLLNLNHPQKFSLAHRQSILSFVFLDLILVLKTIKENTQGKAALLNYLCLHSQDPNIRSKIEKTTQRDKSTIYSSNKDSSIIHLLFPKKSRRTIKIKLENQALIQDNPLISFIEVSKGVDNHKLEAFLTGFKAISEQVLSLMAKEGKTLSNELKFGLRLRRIKHTYKKGFFIVEQNVIVLDPRHTDSLTHEIGHWYHTHFKPELQTVEECEAFAENFYISL